MREVTLKNRDEKGEYSGIGLRKPVKAENSHKKKLTIEKAVIVLIMNALLEYEDNQEKETVCPNSPKVHYDDQFDDLYDQCYQCVKTSFEVTNSCHNLQEVYPYIYSLVKAYKNSV
ncbi:hypothetical protein ENUP19_0305G0030 [Entamoeba nuttalli]|uniref:Uncharacterized protein n=2 Tax=Entamoeba nuttalli TaxID=412467 RepID=K2HYI3_ENTNP|nr:hypothetical protein ENU1_055630 [Entamoeba nuttalli P19]EKE41460.1 hypothetical protein ENU1_055630 [Entamoeba nuttalli P19]|eukprot:XP_008856213.1 hypothetical protein ENU1_055630 [Entamoeba nuttalli P19]